MSKENTNKTISRKQVNSIFDALAATIIPKPELNFSNAFELLVAVVLSAQCTDKTVNSVTSELWKTMKEPADYLRLGQDALMQAIRKIGFYRVKSAHIIELCKKLMADFNGQVPSTREELMTLPGVGRKTANVVLNLWFGENVIAVDTHIFRVSHRLSLSNGATPDDVEQDLMKLTPKKYLKDAHHYLLLHGRYTCQARSPKCDQCVLKKLCPTSPTSLERRL